MNKAVPPKLKAYSIRMWVPMWSSNGLPAVRSCRLFLSHGADVNLQNKEGETPVECCSLGSQVWTALQANRKLKDAAANRSSQERVVNRQV